MVSEQARQDEEVGLFHFMIVAGDKGVYSYDPVCNTTMIPIITGLKNPTSVVVDPENKFLFVSDVDAGTNKSYVYRYSLEIHNQN